MPAFANRCYEWQADNDALEFCDTKQAYAQAIKMLQQESSNEMSTPYDSHPSIQEQIDHAQKRTKRKNDNYHTSQGPHYKTL